MEIQYFRQPDVLSGIPPQVVRAGDFVFFAGGIAAHPTKGIPDEVMPEVIDHPFHGSSIERQLRYIYNNMAATLQSSGSSIKRVMKINTYQTNTAEIDAALRLRKDYFGTESPPPSTLVVVPETAVRGASVTNDVVVLASDAKLDREVIHKGTNKTSLPVHDIVYGHRVFINAVRGGGFIFTAGKAVIKEGGKPVTKEDAFGEIFNPVFPYRINHIKRQTELTLDFFKALLEDMGASMEDVVKADIYLENVKDIASMDEAWRKYFPTSPPARTITVAEVLATNRVIEIELIAADPQGPYHKKVISSPKVPVPIDHEPQAVKAGPYLFLSGQLATDYKNGVALAARVDPNFPFHSSSIKRQVHYILKNVEAICQAGGTSARNLVRRRAIHTNLNELSQAEEVWAETLGDRLPPTTTFRTEGPLPVPGCTVQYDLIAFAPADS